MSVHWSNRRQGLAVAARAEGRAGVACVNPLGLIGSDGAVVGVVRCGRWCCPACAEKNRRRLYARAMDGEVGVASERYLLTFTLRRLSYVGAADAYRVMREAWRCWLQRLRRAGWRGEFLRTVESHRSGYPHLHVLVTARVPVQWLTQGWCHCVRLACRRLGVTAGWLAQDYPGNVDVSRKGHSRPAQGVGYVLKYLQKSMSLPSVRRELGATRLWGASRGALAARYKPVPILDVKGVVSLRRLEREDWERRQAVERATRALTWNNERNVYELGTIAQGRLFEVKRDVDGHLISIHYHPPDGGNGGTNDAAANA